MISNLAVIKELVAAIRDALEAMNFGQALKLSGDLQKALEDTPLEFIDFDKCAIEQALRAERDRARAEYEKKYPNRIAEAN
jgi:hypothetical protein